MPALKKEPLANENYKTFYSSKHTCSLLTLSLARNEKLKALVDKHRDSHDYINLRGDRSVRKGDYRQET